MEESETIVDFNSKFYDIANECYILEEKIFWRKTRLKSITFSPKMIILQTVIEEAKDVLTMKMMSL